jgi:hypothetical protein
MENPKDPVFREQDGYYFFDESETNRFGPYPTIGVARIHLINYYHTCLKEAAKKVEQINEELKTHNIKSCACEGELLPEDAIEEIPEEPKIKAEPKVKKELSNNAILIIWAAIITAIITAYAFSDFKVSNLFSTSTFGKPKVEVTIKPKEATQAPAPVAKEEPKPTVTPTEEKKPNEKVCIKGYDHYIKFMDKNEQFLKDNNFGITVWENTGANKGNALGKLKPGECVLKLDQKGNNVFIYFNGMSGWIHSMDIVK